MGDMFQGSVANLQFARTVSTLYLFLDCLKYSSYDELSKKKKSVFFEEKLQILYIEYSIN